MNEPRPLKLKLRPRAPPPFHVPRPRLVERVLGLGRGEWALLCAPAGYGKTVLASEVAGACRYPTSWVTVDPNDDLARFAAHLLAACAATLDGFGQEIRLAFDRGVPSTDLMPAVLNDLGDIECDFLLVIDDLHTSEDPEVSRVVLRLAELASSNLRLLVTTRTEPAVTLHGMRARGSLVQLRGEDLAFHAEEIRHVLARAVERVPAADDARRILEATRGWPLAIQLIASTLRRGVTLEQCLERLVGDSDLLAVFARDALDTLTTPLRQAVLTLAPFEQITAPLCEAVVPTSDGELILRELDRSNAFVTALDESRSVYAFHPVWSSFLRQQARRELGTDAIAISLRRASCYFERSGHLEQAIDLAVAAGDADRAIESLEKTAFGLLAEGRGSSVLRWLDRLGERAQTSTLLAARAWAELLSLRWPEAERTAKALRGAAASSRARAAVLGHAAAVQAVLAFAIGDVAQGAIHADEALELLPPSDPARAAVLGDRGVARARAGDRAGATEDLRGAAEVGRGAIARGAAWSLAELELQAGDVELARSRNLEAIGIDPDLGHPSRAALAEIAREADEMGEAWDRVDAFVDHARTQGSAYGLAMGLLGRARVAASSHRFDVARDHLVEAILLVERTRLRQWIAGLHGIRALVSLLAFVHGSDERFLAESGASIEHASGHGLDGPSHMFAPNLAPELVGLAAARLELVTDSPGPAIAALGRWRADASAQARARSLLEIDLVAAHALAHAGDAGAETAFAAATARATAAGFVRLARDEAPLFARLRGGRAPGPGDRAPPVVSEAPLSRRELEVLAIVAAGASTADTARRLHVSPATVKKHLENIYLKLDVNGRMQAVATARGHGWLAQ